jgi:hypothetical protein
MNTFGSRIIIISNLEEPTDVIMGVFRFGLGIRQG